MLHPPRRWIALVAALALAIAPLANAGQVPAAMQATLVLRILSFDHALPTRTTGPVRIAILYREGQAASEATGRDLASALSKLAKKSTVSNRQIEIVPLAFSAVPKLEADFAEKKITAAYLCPGLDDVLPQISKLASARSVLTFTGVEDYIRKGASVALVLRDTRAGIVIHLPTARAAGADLDAGLLRIAEVLR